MTHRNTTRMNFGIYHTDTAIRFRRWNRSRYAAFCSIGKSVTIGMLKRSIADSSLRKAKSEKGLDYTQANTWAPEYPETTEYDDRALLLQAMSVGDVLFPTSDQKENRIKKVILFHLQSRNIRNRTDITALFFYKHGQI